VGADGGAPAWPRQRAAAVAAPLPAPAAAAAAATAAGVEEIGWTLLGDVQFFRGGNSAWAKTPQNLAVRVRVEISAGFKGCLN